MHVAGIHIGWGLIVLVPVCLIVAHMFTYGRRGRLWSGIAGAKRLF